VASYRISLTSSAEKELHELPAKMIARIFPRLEALMEAPRPSGCKKLEGGDKEYRIRVGDYRIVYTIDDPAKVIEVTRVAHRREVYD
jgi:mRNA interferase RelE/StbE